MDSANLPLLTLREEDGRRAGGIFSCRMPDALRQLTLKVITKVVDVFMLALMCLCAFYTAYLLVAEEPHPPCKSTSAPMAGEVLILLIPFAMFFLVLLNSCMVMEMAAEWATLLAIHMDYGIILLGWTMTSVFGVPPHLILNACGTLLGIHLCVCLMSYLKVVAFIQDRLFPRGEGVGE